MVLVLIYSLKNTNKYSLKFVVCGNVVIKKEEKFKMYEDFMKDCMLSNLRSAIFVLSSHFR